jgi:hypothetical protein
MLPEQHATIDIDPLARIEASDATCSVRSTIAAHLLDPERLTRSASRTMSSRRCRARTSSGAGAHRRRADAARARSDQYQDHRAAHATEEFAAIVLRANPDGR